MVLKTLCAELLTKAYSRSFVNTNAASLPGKGMFFSLNTLINQLHRHYRKYGQEGGIYLFDFKNYFGSLPHNIIKERARNIILDDKLYKLFCSYVDDFQKMGAYNKNADKPRGVGLGSEISQIIALDYTSPLDHYIKDILGIEGYGRYMDDGYVISNSLEELKQIKATVEKIVQDLDLKLSDKKNYIIPFKHHSFTFLKKRFTLTKTGQVVVKISRKSIKAMRRKLKIFYKWVQENKMKFESVVAAYQSWRASGLQYNTYKTIESLDATFCSLFEKELADRTKKFKCYLQGRYEDNQWKYTRITSNILPTIAAA